jgi:hypothetical protein
VNRSNRIGTRHARRGITDNGRTRTVSTVYVYRIRIRIRIRIQYQYSTCTVTLDRTFSFQNTRKQESTPARRRGARYSTDPPIILTAAVLKNSQILRKGTLIGSKIYLRL